MLDDIVRDITIQFVNAIHFVFTNCTTVHAFDLDDTVRDITIQFVITNYITHAGLMDSGAFGVADANHDGFVDARELLLYEEEKNLREFAFEKDKGVVSVCFYACGLRVFVGVCTLCECVYVCV